MGGIFRDKTAAFYFLILVTVLGLGVFGPMIAPYPIDTYHTGVNGEIRILEAPSEQHLLGTDSNGRDVLSRLLWGARPTMIVGILGGGILITIGLTVGVTAGYVGGYVETVLMRITDLAYSTPILPFALALVALYEVGFLGSIVIIGALLWRGSARVIRSQVLQIKQRPYIMAAQAAGASRTRIVFKHILPNIAPMAILFFALGVGYSILIQAGLAFIGVSNPFIPAWGTMIRNAFNSGYLLDAWWWSLPPGILISLTVLSTFMFGREYERTTSDTVESMVQ